MPSQAQSILQRLPQKTLLLDLVIAKAYLTSDSAKIVRSLETSIDVPLYQYSSDLDTWLTLNGQYQRNDENSLSVFESKSTQIFNFNLSKSFSTGTYISFDFNELYNQLTPGNTLLDRNTSTGKVSLGQNLWKDFFGNVSRNKLAAGEELREANKYNYQINLQKWVIDLATLYYGVWFVQEQVRASKEDLARQKRLLDITKIKLNRGTAEKPDLIQVEGAFVNSKIELENNQQTLQKAWRELVLTLKFPMEWMAIDAILIPLALDVHYTKALSLCMEVSKKIKEMEKNLEVQYALAQKNANERLFDSADNAYAPELKLEGGYSSDSSIGTFSDRWSDVFSSRYSGWTLGLTFKMPLEWSSEKANYQRTLADYESAKATYEKSKADHIVSWTNSCEKLKSSIANKELLKSTVKNQAERTRLEERRFQLGKIQTFQVIQAGKEQTSMELGLRRVEIEVNQLAWDILKLNGDVQDYLNQVVKSYGSYQF